MGDPQDILRRAFEKAFDRPAPAGARVDKGWEDMRGGASTSNPSPRSTLSAAASSPAMHAGGGSAPRGGSQGSAVRASPRPFALGDLDYSRLAASCLRGGGSGSGPASVATGATSPRHTPPAASFPCQSRLPQDPAAPASPAWDRAHDGSVLVELKGVTITTPAAATHLPAASVLEIACSSGGRVRVRTAARDYPIALAASLVEPFLDAVAVSLSSNAPHAPCVVREFDEARGSWCGTPRSQRSPVRGGTPSPPCGTAGATDDDAARAGAVAGGAVAESTGSPGSVPEQPVPMALARGRRRLSPPPPAHARASRLQGVGVMGGTRQSPPATPGSSMPSRQGRASPTGSSATQSVPSPSKQRGQANHGHGHHSVSRASPRLSLPQRFVNGTHAGEGSGVGVTTPREGEVGSVSTRMHGSYTADATDLSASCESPRDGAASMASPASSTAAVHHDPLYTRTHNTSPRSGSGGVGARGAMSTASPDSAVPQLQPRSMSPTSGAGEDASGAGPCYPALLASATSSAPRAVARRGASSPHPHPAGGTPARNLVDYMTESPITPTSRDSLDDALNASLEVLTARCGHSVSAMSPPTASSSSSPPPLEHPHAQLQRILEELVKAQVEAALEAPAARPLRLLESVGTGSRGDGTLPPASLPDGSPTSPADTAGDVTLTPTTPFKQHPPCAWPPGGTAAGGGDGSISPSPDMPTALPPPGPVPMYGESPPSIHLKRREEPIRTIPPHNFYSIQHQHDSTALQEPQHDDESTVACETTTSTLPATPHPASNAGTASYPASSPTPFYTRTKIKGRPGTVSASLTDTGSPNKSQADTGSHGSGRGAGNAKRQSKLPTALPPAKTPLTPLGVAGWPRQPQPRTGGSPSESGTPVCPPPPNTSFLTEPPQGGTEPGAWFLPGAWAADGHGLGPRSNAVKLAVGDCCDRLIRASGAEAVKCVPYLLDALAQRLATIDAAGGGGAGASVRADCIAAARRNVSIAAAAYARHHLSGSPKPAPTPVLSSDLYNYSNDSPAGAERSIEFSVGGADGAHITPMQLPIRASPGSRDAEQ